MLNIKKHFLLYIAIITLVTFLLLAIMVGLSPYKASALSDKTDASIADINTYNPQNSFAAMGMPEETKEYDCAGMSQSECLKNNPIIKWVQFFATLFAAIVGVGAVIMVIIAGLQYSAARDNAQSIQAAKSKLTNVLIGLVAFVFLYSFLQWLIPGGVFGENVSGSPTSSVAITSSSSSGGSSASGTVPSPKPTATTVSITSLDNVDNFRDAGGTGYLKSNILYRSGNLSNADASQVAALLGSGTIIDLRTSSIIKGSPDVSVRSVTTINYPIHGTENYNEFVTNADSRNGFAKAITAIANTDGKILLHCTHGKDRTGWTVAMLMYAIGASDSQVQSEYLKSSDVNADMLKVGLSKARDEYGSINNYLRKGLGLSESTITKLKNKLGT